MPTTKGSRTLLVAFHRIGDLVLRTPLFRALARRTELSLVTRPFGPALLGEQPYLRQVFPLDYPNRGSSRLGGLLLGGHRRELGRQLAAEGFDEVLIYETERGVVRRWLDDAFADRVKDLARPPAYQGHTSELCRMAAASVGCDMDLYDPTPVLDVPERARERARTRFADLGERVVGIQMGSQRTHVRRPAGARPNLKSPGAAQWQAFIARLVDEDHADAIVLHGAPREHRMVQDLMGGLPASARNRCHDFTTDVGLDLLPALLAQHTALVSVDTGTAHIAASVGCPLLVLFGPTDPARFGPRGNAPVEVLLGEAPCQFCHTTPLYKSCRDNRCLTELPADRWWAAWKHLRAAGC